MELNRRTMIPLQSEFTAREAEDELYIEGYFSVFGSPYHIMAGVDEQIAPGAFTDTLGEDIRALTNHDTTLCLLYTSPSPRDSTSSRMPSSA